MIDEIGILYLILCILLPLSFIPLFMWWDERQQIRESRQWRKENPIKGIGIEIKAPTNIAHSVYLIDKEDKKHENKTYR